MAAEIVDVLFKLRGGCGVPRFAPEITECQILAVLWEVDNGLGLAVDDLQSS